MKKSHSFALMAAVVLTSLTGLTACSSSSDVEEVNNPNVVYDDQGTAGVKPEFVISFPNSVVGSKTRMTDNETQSLGTYDQFRGMDHIRLIPFKAEPTSSTEKLASIMALTSIQTLKKGGSLNYKVYADQFVPMLTTHFLFYGKAIDNAADVDISTMSDKFKYGVVKATHLSDAEFTKPSDLTFGLEPINSSSEQQAGNAVGGAIVQLMTSLANITASAEAPNNLWSTTTNKPLSRLYKNFIGTTVSSSNSLSAILGMIYDGVDRVLAADANNALAKAIKEKIKSASASEPVSGSPIILKNDYAGYPANIGLPDGAARVRWDHTNGFVDMSATYGQGLKKIKITDYVYPAALWYYISTPLKASNDVQSANYDAKTTWNEVINNVYNGSDDAVGGATQSVALVNPVQYAVGRIETNIKMGSGTFYDGSGQEVAVGTGYKLKGILFGGQNSVGYDFASKGSESWTIYDRHLAGDIVATPGNITATANQTLALQTKADQVIYAALELVNGGEAFQGADGIIPAGGTFYLTVELDPQNATGTTGSGYNPTTMNKIVMKDHVTKLTITIKNGSTTAPAVYLKDANGVPTGVDVNGDGIPDPYDIDGDGNNDNFISAADGGPGWDIDGDGIVDIPVLPDPTTGNYPDKVHIPEGLGNAYNGIPDLSSPGVELGTSVDLKWEQGLTLEPQI